MFNLWLTTSFSHRAVALASVLLMHALVIYSLSCLFLYSRGREVPNLEVRVLPRTQAPTDPLMLPEVDLQKGPPVEVAPPEFVPELPAEQSQIAVEKLPDLPIMPEIPVTTVPPQEFAASGPLIGPRPISGPHTPDLYPSKSIAAHERGRVVMIICISSSGKVDDVKLAASSGYPHLDEAGLNIAAQYRFKPATRKGIPVPECVRYQINFRIDI